MQNRDVELSNRCRRTTALFGLALRLVVPAVAGQMAQSDYAPEREIRGLPSDAVTLETQVIPMSAHTDRMLTLWMQNPQKHARGEDEYTCPERTRGNCYSGPTRVSLVRTSTGEIINTVRVTIKSVIQSGNSKEEREDDSFDIPYLIERILYHVDTPGERGEGKPKIMKLRDYNADGRALEFALFNAETCSDVRVQLIGYSIPRDRVIQYPFRSDDEPADGKPWFWADNLFAHKPVAKGHWHYTMPFPGSTCVFDFRYAQSGEEFLTRATCY